MKKMIFSIAIATLLLVARASGISPALASGFTVQPLSIDFQLTTNSYYDRNRARRRKQSPAYC